MFFGTGSACPENGYWQGICDEDAAKSRNVEAGSGQSDAFLAPWFDDLTREPSLPMFVRNVTSWPNRRRHG